MEEADLKVSGLVSADSADLVNPDDFPRMVKQVQVVKWFIT